MGINASQWGVQRLTFDLCLVLLGKFYQEMDVILLFLRKKPFSG